MVFDKTEQPNERTSTSDQSLDYTGHQTVTTDAGEDNAEGDGQESEDLFGVFRLYDHPGTFATLDCPEEDLLITFQDNGTDATLQFNQDDLGRFISRLVDAYFILYGEPIA